MSAGDWGQEWGVTASEYGVSLLGDENILELDGDNNYKTL